MPNKKISDFTLIRDLSADDIFLLDHQGSTRATNLSSISDNIIKNINIPNILKYQTVISGNIIPDPAIGLTKMGSSHYCVSYYSQKSVYQIGYTGSGVYGNGTVPAKPVKRPFLDNYMQMNNVTIKKCYMNFRNSFVLLSDGTFWGYGNSLYWQNVINNTTNQNCIIYIKLNSMFGGKQVVDFSVNDAYGYTDSTTLGIICSDNTCYVWGYNGWGQLGNGTVVASRTPIQVTITGKTPVQISVGGTRTSDCGTNTMIRMSDGTVYACGWNKYGTLGVGNNAQQNSFTQCKESSTVNLSNVAEIIECGTSNLGYSRYIRKNDGTIWSTGLNNSGSLGIGSTASVNYFTKVQFPAGVGAITKLVTTGWSTNTSLAAIDSNKKLYTWGYAGYGAIGQGSSTASNIPKLVTVYRKSVTEDDVLPNIKNIFGSTNTNAGSLGLISENGEVFLAGVYTYSPVTNMYNGSDHTNVYYKFEKRHGIVNAVDGAMYGNLLDENGDYVTGYVILDSSGGIHTFGIDRYGTFGLYAGERSGIPYLNNGIVQ